MTRWECDKCGIITRGATPTDECEVCHAFSFTLLSGTRRMEKPQPRERSAKGRVVVDVLDAGRSTVVVIPDLSLSIGTQVTATWQE